ncbi:MAG: hypothetical protein LBS42_08380 [Tannerella sp.]|jgi:hypothetical protein|nr:hypothetical protein [Tannerella sp.]
MRNGSCIFAKQRDGEEAVLFEGGHPIPFFWLLLLDSDDIRALHEKLKQIPRNANAGDVDASIGLDKLKALIRAADRRDYVKRHYPVCLLLYDDWLYFMQISDFSDMKIYLDLYETSLNHHDLEHFTGSMQKAITCFDENREAWFDCTIAGTCGREGRNKNRRRFDNMSEAYRNLNRQDLYGHFENRKHLYKKRFPPGAKRIILLLCLAALLVAACFYFIRI